MHTLISSGLSEMAAQRRAVVFAVSQEVPEADPELAASFGLEQLCREIAVHGPIDRPVDFWHDAAIDAATEGSAIEVADSRNTDPRAGAGTRTRTTGSGTTVTQRVGVAPPATATVPATSEHGAHPEEHGEAAPTHARTQLPPSIEPTERTTGLPRSVRRRLPQSPNRLASVTALGPDVCRSTRGAMHDYIRHRLLPGRRRELEDHLVDCAACARAFTDIRESYWLQQAAPPVVQLGTVSLPDGPHLSPAVAR